MTITFPRAFPTHTGVRGVSFAPRNTVGVNTSPSSGVEQMYEWPHERWAGAIRLPAMKRGDAAPWVSWLISMRGPIGSFTMGHPDGLVPRGTASGSPTCSGAVRTRTLTLTGGSGTLLVGDFISVGSNRWLHMVENDVTLSGGGVSVDIWPALRATASGAAAVTGAMGRFRLISMPEWDGDEASNYPAISFPFIEDLRP